MPKFEVKITEVYARYITIEADTEYDAISEAQEWRSDQGGIVGIHHCFEDEYEIVEEV